MKRFLTAKNLHDTSSLRNLSVEIISTFVQSYSQASVVFAQE